MSDHDEPHGEERPQAELRYNAEDWELYIDSPARVDLATLFPCSRCRP